MRIDFRNNYVKLFRKKVILHFTSSGRYCILFTNNASNLKLQGNYNNALYLDCLNNKEGKQNKTCLNITKVYHYNLFRMRFLD